MKLVQCEPPDGPMWAMEDMAWYTLEPGGIPVYGRIGFPPSCELRDEATLEALLLMARESMAHVDDCAEES